MSHPMPYVRRASKCSFPSSSTKPTASALPNTVHLAAHRLASNLGVPLGVALAHVKAAGLGTEAGNV